MSIAFLLLQARVIAPQIMKFSQLSVRKFLLLLREVTLRVIELSLFVVLNLRLAFVSV